MVRITGTRFDAGRSFHVATQLRRLPFEMQINGGISGRKVGGKQPFINAPLTVYLEAEVEGEKRFLRAADLLRNGKFDSKAPAAAANVLAFEVVTPNGLILADPSVLNGKTPAEVDEYLIQVDILHAAVASRKLVNAAASHIPVPSPEEMLTASGLGNIRVAPSFVTNKQIGALVKLLVQEGDKEISEQDANDLIIIANEADIHSAAEYIRKPYIDKLIKRANSQNPGRNFRLPTKAELLEIFAKLGNQLGDICCWIWTKTETSEGSGIFVLCHPSLGCRNSDQAACQFSSSEALLVEDVPA